MQAYLSVKYAYNINPREFWLEGEIDDAAVRVSECWTFFKPNPDLTLRRLAGIMYDMSLAGVQSKLVVGD